MRNKRWQFLSTITFLLIFSSVNCIGQEYTSVKSYTLETGQEVLGPGCWLKKDRKKENKRWANANVYNLQLEKGHLKYDQISQIRDYYKWFDQERKQQGRSIKSAGIAWMAAKQLSKVENPFLRIFIVRNKEVVCFVQEGSQHVFEFAFPLMKQRYFSKQILSSTEAVAWDFNNGQQEQCHVLDSLYQKLSPRAFKRLLKMAKGKGVFRWGVSKKLRFTGDLYNCEDRFNHGATKLLKQYNALQ